MESATIQRRKRKRSCDMTIKELQQLEFLNGAQAARYCEISPRTFYYYLQITEMPKYTRQTISNSQKILYRRKDLDELLRPKSTLQKAKFILLLEQKHISDRKKGKSSRSQINAATVLQRAMK